MDIDKFQKMFDLTGRVAIVTGGTRGVGRSIAEGFVAAGAKVVVASRKPEACAETAAHLIAMGGEAIGVPTHLGELPALAALVQQTVQRFGRLDIVVNNAANALAQPLGQFTTEAWDKSYAVNLRGPVFLVQEALPYLKASPCASVINVISGSVFTFAPEVAIYAGAKAALWSFTGSMAAAFAASGIRVNAIAPGPVDTDMMRKNPPETQKAMAESCYFRRAAHPDEMVGPALLLASDAGSFITGQVIIADGGGVFH